MNYLDIYINIMYIIFSDGLQSDKYVGVYKSYIKITDKISVLLLLR